MEKKVLGLCAVPLGCEIGEPLQARKRWTQNATILKIMLKLEEPDRKEK